MNNNCVHGLFCLHIANQLPVRHAVDIVAYNSRNGTRAVNIPPYLSDRSQTRCPQMPELATTMVSPGSRQLAMVASMPACPVPLT